MRLLVVDERGDTKDANRGIQLNVVALKLELAERRSLRTLAR